MEGGCRHESISLWGLPIRALVPGCVGDGAIVCAETMRNCLPKLVDHSCWLVATHYVNLDDPLA